MKIKNIIAAIALPFTLTACTKVAPGYVAIAVNNYGSDKGVLDKVYGPGWYWEGLSWTYYDFPTFTQTYTWSKSPNEGAATDESFSFQTSDGMEVGADIGISYHIDPDKVPQVFQKYRKGIDEITHIYLHNYVRDALVNAGSQYTVEQVYGNAKVALLEAAQKLVSSQVSQYGIIIEKLSWAGQPRLPDVVQQAINAKVQATQMAQQRENEVATAQAEAQKAIATAHGQAESALILAQNEAKANLVVAQSITPTLVQWEALKHWNGQLPLSSGGGTVPFINLNALAATNNTTK